MPNTPSSEPLLLCEGKDCFKKQRSAYRSLESAAREADLSVSGINCQGSCAGPTAVVQTPDGPRWFENLQTQKSRDQVVAFAGDPTGRPGKALRKRELTGKAAVKARKKLKVIER